MGEQKCREAFYVEDAKKPWSAESTETHAIILMFYW